MIDRTDRARRAALMFLTRARKEIEGVCLQITSGGASEWDDAQYSLALALNLLAQAQLQMMAVNGQNEVKPQGRKSP